MTKPRLDQQADAFCQQVAARITARRKSLGLSVNRLSEEAHVAQSMMAYVEKGERKPTIHTLFRIATALKTTPQALLSDAEDVQVELKKVGSTRVRKLPTVKKVATKER